MPELPEVETVRRGLAPALEGARLAEVRVGRPDLRFPFPERFADRLVGARVGALDRRAKYLLAPLDTGETLVMHLGMTGRFEIEGPGVRRRPGHFALAPPADPVHAHVRLVTDRGDTVTYFDARRFGYMGLAPSAGLGDHPWFARLGPEPLGPDFHGESLGRAVAGRSQAIKSLLLDQRVVAGVGNIYACEALHRARISPFARGGRLSAGRLERLTASIREVLAEAIEAGGSTLRDYAGADGALGYFQHRFRVYGREDEPCPTPGCTGRVRRRVQAGRSTFHCPSCQR